MTHAGQTLGLLAHSKQQLLAYSSHTSVTAAYIMARPAWTSVRPKKDLHGWKFWKLKNLKGWGLVADQILAGDRGNDLFGAEKKNATVVNRSLFKHRLKEKKREKRMHFFLQNLKYIFSKKTTTTTKNNNKKKKPEEKTKAFSVCLSYLVLRSRGRYRISVFQLNFFSSSKNKQTNKKPEEI